jgi:hypothetical protein
MQLEVIAELLAYVVAAGVLTTLGMLAELSSLGRFAAGEMTVALWFAGVGALLLYAGVYKLGYQTVLDRAFDLSA